jgi:hypothetical protein
MGKLSPLAEPVIDILPDIAEVGVDGAALRKGLKALEDKGIALPTTWNTHKSFNHPITCHPGGR